ncbi:putative photosynthetic complex assembly protein PuhE [Rhodocyclus purpureus]|uniref:putative photosynthetic complex assembly protein PuhE n=1 Tax=Rhodocyclus purpureus TaxID=1067 RepID=UPI00191389B9|nr:putative photosynthetic complex assembly protein PuhE [Rhodocyclus purpureus]MBK5915013.1 hypothetical protein [Rhodocyclus purpureus]
MSDFASYAIPAAFAAFVWWSSTGVIFYLDGLPRQTFRWSMAGATILLVGALVGLAASSQETSVAAAHQSFFCAIVIWAWFEMSFLMGFIIGPRRALDRPPTEGFQRFVNATEAILYHEIALVFGAVLVWALTADAPNLVGAWTFAVLWVMRLSAKLNLFLGVRNLSAELLPEHLSHLRQYLTQRPMNVLFPIAVSAAGVVTVFLIREILSFPPDSFEASGLTLVTTLLGLAIVEHWLMVIPINGARLWEWSLDERRRDKLAQTADTESPVEAQGAAQPTLQSR